MHRARRTRWTAAAGRGDDGEPARETVLIRLRLIIYYAAVFAVLGAWIPFWPLWLEERGCSKAEIGVVLSVAIWARVLATPWLAARADRTGRRKATVIILSWAAALGFVPFAWADSMPAWLLLSLWFGITYPALIPLSDGLTILQARRTPGLRYGRIRLWGSLAFLLTVVLLGRLLRSEPTDIVHTVIVAALCLAGLAAFALPDPRPDDDGSHHRTRRPIRTLLRDRSFVLVLAATGLIQASHAAYYSFSTLHWKAAGIDEGTIGLLWAEGVVAEIVLFAIGAAWATRVGTVKLFVIGGTAALVRWVAMASSTDVAVLAATNWLHSLSFGATHLAAIGYVTRAVPQALTSTAQGLLAALSTGAATALATLLAGGLYDATPGGAFGSMLVLAAAGIAFALALGRRLGRATA